MNPERLLWIKLETIFFDACSWEISWEIFGKIFFDWLKHYFSNARYNADKMGVKISTDLINPWVFYNSERET